MNAPQTKTINVRIGRGIFLFNESDLEDIGKWINIPRIDPSKETMIERKTKNGKYIVPKDRYKTLMMRPAVMPPMENAIMTRDAEKIVFTPIMPITYDVVSFNLLPTCFSLSGAYAQYNFCTEWVDDDDWDKANICFNKIVYMHDFLGGNSGPYHEKFMDMLMAMGEGGYFNITIEDSSWDFPSWVYNS